MIVNSHPYNPSQQSQQQRCIGLNSQQQQQQQQEPSSTTTMSRLLNMSQGNSQQNSLYGSAFGNNRQMNQAATMQQQQQQQQSHMLDLANLQQSVFDSPYDVANNNGQDFNNISRTNNRRPSDNQQQQSAQQNDISLYSPSSSTSLLYHIYDQINLPNEHHQYQQQQQQQQQQTDSHLTATHNGKKSNTTILNPANLFSQQPAGNLPLPMQLHQHQLSHVAELQKSLGVQQQQHYNGSQQFPIGGQATFGGAATMHHQHQSSYGMSVNNHLMLDTVMRQHHQAATAARHQQQQRPLSSSGGSSTMSGQSVPIAYGRQPRTMSSSSKSQNNLASVLQSSNTLTHLGIGSSPTSINPAANNKHNIFSTRWKRMNQRARHYVYEYRTIVKCSILLILLAFSLMSIIKFTLLSASLSSPSSNHASQVMSTSSQQQLGNSNTLLYQQFPKFNDQNLGPQTPVVGLPNMMSPTTEDDETPQWKLGQQQQQQTQQLEQDVLNSKLVIGEFVIVSQNYSQSPAQKSLLAERIVKLMDQVFLADSAVRRVYSRMEVTNIRPNRPTGIVVDCNIILSESIAYAAQQFGYALYHSLIKSHERLANQANYIIDRNSIRFNTVPDKDLKSGIVPPGLISPSVSRELTANSDQAAPSIGGQPLAIEPSFSSGPPMQPGAGSSSTSDNLAEQMNLVVWSEWSQWSSCVDKNGICDSTRLHSRLRKCVAQHTGEKVDASQCKQRFNMQDQELEVADCSRSCSQQQQQLSADNTHIMSDAPSIIGPQTAPSVMVGGNDSPASSPFMTAPMLTSANSNKLKPPVKPEQQQQSSSSLLELYTPPSSSSAAAAAASGSSGSVIVPSPLSIAPASSSASSLASTERSQQHVTGNDILSTSLATPTMMPPLTLLDPNNGGSEQMSCSNCTSDEICLLLQQQKVPFCAKIKDRADESGCGGWCKAQNQICHSVGQNAFKCIHDSECLAEEWRCHNSACIPLSKRCDGHSNCYDSSDERDCPIVLV